MRSLENMIEGPQMNRFPFNFYPFRECARGFINSNRLTNGGYIFKKRVNRKDTRSCMRVLSRSVRVCVYSL